MSYIVGMSAAIAILRLGRGKIKKRGTGCAWLIEDPEGFLEECKRRGVIAYEKIEKF